MIWSILYSPYDIDRIIWIIEHRTSNMDSIIRLNSGTKNRNNFFVWAIFLIQKLGINSVIYADSGDTKILVQFPGNSILKIFENAWVALICVGV